MASRRGILKKGAIGGGLVFGGLAIIGGIASETDLIDDPDDDETEQAGDDNSDTDDGGPDEESEQDPTTLVQGEAHSREHWRFEVVEGERIEIHLEVRERPTHAETIKVDVETVAEGEVAEWEFPPEDVERTFEYTAEASAEHTLKVYHAGITEVEVVLYGG